MKITRRTNWAAIEWVAWTILLSAAIALMVLAILRHADRLAEPKPHLAAKAQVQPVPARAIPGLGELDIPGEFATEHKAAQVAKGGK